VKPAANLVYVNVDAEDAKSQEIAMVCLRSLAFPRKYYFWHLRNESQVRIYSILHRYLHREVDQGRGFIIEHEKDFTWHRRQGEEGIVGHP
jgi:hypothetical protein